MVTLVTAQPQIPREYIGFGLLSKYVLVPIVIVMAIRSRVALNCEPLSKRGIFKIIKAVKKLYN
jgi:hypothetical protein